MKLKSTYYDVRKYTSRSAWIILMAFSSLTAVKSQNLLTESFNYVSGTLLTNANWLQLAAGTPAIAVSNGNLSRAGTIANDFGNKVTLTKNGEDVYRNFTATTINAATPAVYASAVVNVSAAQATGDYFISLNDIARLYIRSNGTGFSFGVMRSSGTVAYESTVRPFNTNIRVVLKYEQIAGAANDMVKLYVDPPSGNEPSTADISHTGTATDMTSVSYITLVQGTAANAPTLEVDGITVGTRWASVTSAIYDYGDVPSSYDFTKDGVYAPAAHSPVPNFLLGSVLPDSELTPSSVSFGADNNGANGDGVDEDAINIASNQIRKGIPYTLNVPVSNPSGTKYVYGWIDFNNNGKFEAGEFATVAFSATGNSTQVLTWLPTQTSAIAAGATKLYMRLRISDRILQDFTTAASGGAVIDERSIGNGAVSTGNAADNGIIAGGEVEDYQIQVTNTFDYGDVPSSFENDKDGNPLPALHAPLSGFTMGTLLDTESSPGSAATGADNNGTNGDGVDEDGLSGLMTITKGIGYTLDVSVNNPTTTTKYLYGWIDFNNDGKFQVGEISDVVPTITTTGATIQKLSWSTTKTLTIAPGAAKLYVRVRLSDRSLIDYNSGVNAALIDERSIGNGASSNTVAANEPTVAFGEVEDYQIGVTVNFDYGDVPASFELNNSDTPLPALHTQLPGYSIGSLIDIEFVPGSVVSPSENNMAGDNAIGQIDEDGITEKGSVSRGIVYTLNVPVNIPSTLPGTSYLYGWLDLNGDGRFQANEMTSTSASGIGLNSMVLSWSAAQTAIIANGTSKIYLRLRLSHLNLIDATTTTKVDERSIGNGAVTTADAANNPLALYGEVEDYQLSVDLFDFGDAPAGYELNNSNVPYPARQIASSSYLIGKTVDNELNAQSVSAGADNNNANGDGADEDGFDVSTIVRGAPYNFFTSVRANTASNIIAWIDFNNNGRFEANEAAYPTSTATTNGYQAVGVGENLMNFWFRSSQTSQISAGVTNLYVRIRLTQTAGSDNISTTGVDERSIGDGGNTGIYASPALGEVEDYRFSVGASQYDFGDAPESYEMDKDGTNKPANFKPARNFSTSNLYLGSFYDHETAPSSVSMGSDNNNANGDGTDEDGISSALYMKPGAENIYSIEVKNYTGADATLLTWIDFNNNRRFEAGEVYSYTAIPGAYMVQVPFTAVQTAAIAANTEKIYMRVRLIQAEGGVAIGDNISSTNVDERAIGDGLQTGAYGMVALGEVEDYQLTVVRDYGDIPVSYENGNPAFQTNSPNPDLYLGASVDYELINAAVANGADNNGTNGDGADEDALSVPGTVTSGTPFTISIPVSTAISGTKYLYGWIDFNGDGIFNGNEVATTNVFATPGTISNFTLTWSNTTASTGVLAAGKTYVRFRLSDVVSNNTNNANAALIDTRSFGSNNGSGEVEDYRFNVVSNIFDYGDAPDGYSRNQSGVNIFPRQAISSVLRLGETVDIESTASSVAPNADNNGNNGDGSDEDGITTLMPVYKGTAYYSTVNVFNNTNSPTTLYGWVDFNNNGYFELSELASVVVPNSSVQQTAKLSWSSAVSNTIPAGTNGLYMRLRISESTIMGDNGSVTLDERSVGDGINTGIYGTPYGGEIEDYRLAVATAYDYGDVSNTYDTGRARVLAPARQAVSSGLYIGNNPADYEVNKQIQAGTALGDDNTGKDDEDGVELSPIYGNGGYGYSVRVQVTNNTGVSGNLYGWIDFNNSGSFEAGEAAAIIAVPNGTNNGFVNLNWTNAQSAISGSPSKLYMRLRLSEGILTDFTTGASGSLVDERALADGLNTGEYAAVPVIYNGEVEDHTIQVTNQADFGDVPVYYEENFIGASVPARHLSSADLMIGNTVDIETNVHSVSAGADNNGTNGDGLDEDGIALPLPTLYSGAEYSTLINLKNTLTTSATLHAWIDMNGNGSFSSDEYTFVAIPANSGNYITKLTWPLANYTATGNTTYMRVRLTNGALSDNTATTSVDERSIGDGTSTGAYSVPLTGEVEDYVLPVAPPAVEEPCTNEDNRLGLIDPIQALFHATIAKLANGSFVVFGNSANGSGVNQPIPIKVESGSNGFNFAGVPLMVTGASYQNSNSYGGVTYGAHQYMLLSSAGLYVWGAPGMVFSNFNGAMTQVALPSGVGAANIKMFDAGRNSAIGSLMLLTKLGEVWVYSNTVGHAVQGDGNIMTPGWHQVMTDANTPLTGMKDIRTAGGAALATDGNNFYTWGSNVFLGDGLPAANKNFATRMTAPSGIVLPVKQQDINNDISAAYYLRDSEGNAFVMGNNAVGQLGLGHTNNATTWRPVNIMNEEPEAIGDQTDVTKSIGKVIWISANNHDSYGALFSVITDKNRIYSSGDNDGSKKGVVNPTSAYTLTAATKDNGSQIVPGKMIYVETGGHISISVKDRNDRYGYVGHTIEGSDGCSGCTNSPVEYNFTGPPSVGPVCGNTAFDYGDLDNNYNLGDKASHEIKYSQANNPLKLGNFAADSDDGPQFTITGSGNDALGDDNDGDGGIDDEDAFTGTLPVKTMGTTYSLDIPVTNDTGNTAYLYGFIDWNHNGVFESAEAVTQSVTSSTSQQTITLSWVDNSTIVCGMVITRSFVRLRLTTSNFSDNPATSVDERSYLAAPDGEVEDYYVDWGTEPCIGYCYRPGAIATPEKPALISKVGITSLNRAQAQADNWPAVRKGAWLVIEAKTKGFVPNRLAFDVLGNPIGILPANFVEGMMVYDITNKCLKMYTSKDDGVTFGWHCISTQTCPD